MSCSKEIHISAVDLFCGVGGLTRGLLNAGILVKAGYDIDPICAFPYTHNNGTEFICSDVSKLLPTDVSKHFIKGTFRLLAGCTPCQPFSRYQRNPGPDQKKKWNALSAFQKLVLQISPDFVTLENVPQLIETDIFQRFKSALTSAGYFTFADTVDCSRYGVPQTRRRLVFLASKHAPLKLLEPVDDSLRTTVRDAFLGKGLSKIAAGQTCRRDPLHRAARLTTKNLQRIRASKPGGTWRDWPDELKLSCHQKDSGSTYPSVYGRMSWDNPGSTVTTQFFGYGNGRFGHPEEDRAISIREGALLQTFPDDYLFEAPGTRLSSKNAGRLIGNAVPVKLAEQIGLTFREQLLEL